MEDCLKAEREELRQPPVEVRQNDGPFQIQAVLAGGTSGSRHSDHAGRLPARVQLFTGFVFRIIAERLL